jgi:hypothetical protein
MKKLFVLVTLLISTTAHAGSFWRYGVGIFSSADYGKVETKMFSLGYEEDWFGPFIKQYEVGVFADQGGHGRRSGGFGNFSMGVEVNPGYLVLRSTWGVGAITCPDSMLGGWFQFNQDLLVGLRDNKGNAIGLDCKHISSAGIYSPNTGRDFLTIQVEIPL